VIWKLVEAFFRHKFLILVPPVLIPLIVGPIALVNVQAQYESSASIWVERATYLSYNDGWNGWITPAQNQTNRLGEFLRTRSFQQDVARRTTLAPLIGSTGGEEAIRRTLLNLAVVPDGTNLVTIRFRSDKPETAHEVVAGVVDAFKQRLTEDRMAQAGLAISFYEEQLRTAENELIRSNDDVRRYLAMNPQPLTAASGPTPAFSGPGGPQMNLDAELTGLQRSLQRQDADVEQRRALLERARLEASAALEGQQLGFQVIDAPMRPTVATTDRRKALMTPIAGLAAGLGLSAILLVLLVAGDRSIRNAGDLAVDLPVVGSVPGFRPNRSQNQTGAVAIRRAVGFVAGANPTARAASTASTEGGRADGRLR
jgi:capsular polysaccharide biosynthesis protein